MHDQCEIRPSTKFVFHEQAHDHYRLEMYQPTEKDNGVYELRAVNESGVVVYSHPIQCIEKTYVYRHHETIVLTAAQLAEQELERQKDAAALLALKEAQRARDEYELLKGSGYGAPFHREYEPLEPHRLRFVGQLRDRIGLVGHSIRLGVKVLGPKPEIKWSLDGKPLAGFEYATVKTVNNVSVVDVIRLKLNMSGEYLCEVTSPDCEPISTSCYLRVYEARQKIEKVEPVFTLAIKGKAAISALVLDSIRYLVCN